MKYIISEMAVMLKKMRIGIYILLCRIVRKGFFFLMLLFVVSCQKEDLSPPVNRVLLAYLGGNNNLSVEIEQKIEAMKAGFGNVPADWRVLIFRDTRDAEPVLIEIYPSSNGIPLTREVQNYGGYDSADKETLAKVISDARAIYPEAVFGLIIFSHASGWLPQGTYLNPLLESASTSFRSVIYAGENEMEIRELTSALPEGVFNYIVFETCFMAGIEVGYELRTKTPLILVSSSEIISPGFTEVYPKALHYLFEEDLVAFAQVAFDTANSKNGWQQSATYSIISTSGLEQLKTFIATNASFDTEVNVFDVQHFDRNTYRLFFDMQDYYERLMETDAQRTELSRLIGECVTWKAATSRFMEGYGAFDISRHSGLTTYIPQTEFENLNRAYRELAWCKGLFVE